MFKICNRTFLVSAEEGMTRCSNMACYAFLSFAVESESEDARPSVRLTKFLYSKDKKVTSHLVSTWCFKIMYEGKCLISEGQGFN